MRSSIGMLFSDYRNRGGNLGRECPLPTHKTCRISSAINTEGILKQY